MAIFKRKNFSRDIIAALGWPIDPKPGDVFEDCNFSQLTPGFKIPDTFTGLTFRRCNLVNVLPPGDAIIQESLVVQISRCTNLRPDLIDKGLTPCEENCEHVVDVDEIQVDDGDPIFIYQYEDKRV